MIKANQNINQKPNFFQLFYRIKKNSPNRFKKVAIVEGDLEKSNFGFDKNTRNMLIEETNIIIHCAATIRFDETLKRAINLNVRAVLDLLMMAKEMERLQSFVHVSTAYSFSPIENIGEVFYKPRLNYKQILKLINTLNDENMLGSMTKE